MALNSKTLKIFQYPENNDYKIKKDYDSGFISPLSFPEIKVSVNTLLGN
ncbi:MAG: hypothetical protein AB4057_09050 [Crocosphaera sp.]